MGVLDFPDDASRRFALRLAGGIALAEALEHLPADDELKGSVLMRPRPSRLAACGRRGMR